MNDASAKFLLISVTLMRATGPGFLDHAVGTWRVHEQYLVIANRANWACNMNFEMLMHSSR